MTSLFIDSTYDITLGILDDYQEWRSFEKFSEKKTSNILQTEAYRLLRESGLAPLQLKSIITVAGPGFYTGLRLSEGVADVFKFAGIKHHSLLSYDVPYFSGVLKGTWLTKAYRGEYFFHHWDGTDTSNVLVTDKELSAYLDKIDRSSIYIHSDSALDEASLKLLNGYSSTHDILRNSPDKIFRKVISECMNPGSFYFRAPEDEFRVSK